MFKRIIEKLKAGTDAATVNNDEVNRSSQTIAKPTVMRSLPERRDKFLSDLKRLQEDFNLPDIEFQKGYYAGFEDGCNSIIDTPSGNDA